MLWLVHRHKPAPGALHKLWRDVVSVGSSSPDLEEQDAEGGSNSKHRRNSGALVHSFC